MNIIAWTGIVTMHSAAWGDEAGSTVTFKLPMNDTGESRNPFHDFTKRRKGRAGTRFVMCVTHVEESAKTIYRDEVMLAGWNDSQQNGHTVKMWICNDGMGHPFEGISRKVELALALTELDDDNTAIDQKMRERVESQVATGKQKLSNVAAMFCRTETFWTFTQDIPLAIHPSAFDEESAKQWIYQECGISSRAELDSHAQAAQLFHDNIRKPYEKWHTENVGDPF